MTVNEIPWGPSGKSVYERTYSRTKPDGTKETWPETVVRVVDGNLALAPEKYQLPGERELLIDMMTQFKILPGGRHLWASGVAGRQYLFNCHVSGWGESVTDHFEFTFMRLMEGGGVGANYSNRYLERYPSFATSYKVHVVCDQNHPDYEKLREAGVLSEEYDSSWPGSFDVEDSREGWASSLVDLLGTYYREAKNTNRVFDVSRVREEGARLKTFGGRASGPLPLAVMLHEVSRIMNGVADRGGYLTGIEAMEVDHAIATCVVSGGNRRSARMSIMHWNDPQIEQFLVCKKDGLKHWTTNISVEIDDDFTYLLNKSDGRQAQGVMRKIAESMLTNGEPGLWNSSISNRDEPNEVIATNPCGEITLEGWENCNLGHVNLSAFVSSDKGWHVSELSLAHTLMTRFLIRATNGDVNDPKQGKILARNRRIGVGHLGFASAIAKLGIKYSEVSENADIKELLWQLTRTVDMAATEYCNQLRIPVPVKKRTVAPTGTIAKMPGVSEGIHPIFAKYFIRRIRFSDVDPDQVLMVNAYKSFGMKTEPCLYAPLTTVVEIPTQDTLMLETEYPDVVESADELTLKQMLSVQELYQLYWADNAVSYTANVDPNKYSVEQLYDTIKEYLGTLKGTTIFPEASMPQSPYERLTRKQFEQYTYSVSDDSVDEECASGACPIR
jgi:ribonucleoside-triphosphate reductase